VRDIEEGAKEPPEGFGSTGKDGLGEIEDGGAEAEEDAVLIIVNSGLALPESPNRTIM